MRVDLKCQTVQTAENSGIVRLLDPGANVVQQPGRPLVNPTVIVNLNFLDPEQALQFKPGKVYSFEVTDKQPTEAPALTDNATVPE